MLPLAPLTSPADAPIGVFDSGAGGLSVLRHIRAQLPQEHLMYFADTGFAPYGGKSEQVLVERSLAIAAFLLERGAKALVVACNTATVAAIKALRARYPALPLVGVEPGLKPGAALTRNGKVGVLATVFTLSGEKFLALREQISAASKVEFLLQPCPGLADQVEKGELDTPATVALLEGFIAPLLAQGVDTLVLGCTHYPFVLPQVERIIAQHGAPVALVDTGDAVARQLARLLAAAALQRGGDEAPQLRGYTSADAAALSAKFATLLGLHPQVEEARLAGAPQPL
ncbi:glutamate racemase [Janthinobacterium sp. CG_23.3]|uniref:glutamate racemase n=1 Tax=Janthinobacterium sp. CG_23.3 TaxID=3349634 RepID=UPI0038D4A64E